MRRSGKTRKITSLTTESMLTISYNKQQGYKKGTQFTKINVIFLTKTINSSVMV